MSRMIVEGRGRTCSICGEYIPKITAKELIAAGYWKLGVKKPYRIYFSYFVICPRHTKEEVGEWVAREFDFVSGRPPAEHDEGTTQYKDPSSRRKTARIPEDQINWIVDELERRLKKE